MLKSNERFMILLDSIVLRTMLILWRTADPGAPHLIMAQRAKNITEVHEFSKGALLSLIINVSNLLHVIKGTALIRAHL